jgi:hypothetical protein
MGYFSKVISGTTRPVATTLSAQKLSGATSFQVVAATGWDTGTEIHGIMYRTDTQGNKVAGSQIDWKGTVSGTTVSGVTITAGADDTYDIGDTVELSPTAAWGDDMATGILVEHNQDGTHEDVTADSVSTTDLTVTNAPTFTIGGAIYKQSKYYTYDGTDIFVDGVDQNNAANTIDWTKPTGLKFVVVEVQGGGGAGSGAAATSGTQYSGGAGGGGGCYARKKVLAASLGATETVTVGAAGAGGTGAGGNGGNSSFGAHCTANGGTGGSAQGAITSTSVVGATGGNGSSTGTGDFIHPGQGGEVGTNIASHANGYMSGGGGNSRLGSGGKGNFSNNGGQAGSGYGGGGGAASNALSQSARNGGAGSAGIVIVHEYY